MMAYEYKKLSEVDVVDSVDSSVNILAEQGGNVKKFNIGDLPVPSGQVQADWNEEDGTSPAFIKNKPDLSDVGGTKGVVIVPQKDGSAAAAAGWTLEDGTSLTPLETYEILKQNLVWVSVGDYLSIVTCFYYRLVSGQNKLTVFYINGGGEITSFTCYG